MELADVPLRLTDSSSGNSGRQIHNPSISGAGRRRFRSGRSSASPLVNRLLNVRSLAIHRRKPSLFSRLFRHPGRIGRHHHHHRSVFYSAASAIHSANQSTLRSAQPLPPSAQTDPSGGSGSQLPPGDQTLRPLMERLESHFRLQRQTMGILAQLNDSGGLTEATAAAPAGSESSRGPWASNVLHSIRHWRARRDAFERARSLDSR